MTNTEIRLTPNGMLYESEELYERAITAYFRYGEGNLCQPDTCISGVEECEGKWYVVLRNINGVLAVYRCLWVNDAFKLKKLHSRWPAKLVSVP